MLSKIEETVIFFDLRGLMLIDSIGIFASEVSIDLLHDIKLIMKNRKMIL